MYAQYWGLRCQPFENTPDPRFFYQSAQHQEALARLAYVVHARKGAGLLTGVFGCGKTLTARSLLASLPAARFRVLYFANPLMSEVEVLHGLARKLNVPHLPDRRSDVLVDALLEHIEQGLRDNARDGKDTVVVIDEAHVIREDRVFEELRLLLNFQDDDRFLLTLILMGQPELREMVDRHKPLAQRICLGAHLAPLSLEETAAYVRHRLAVAGAATPLLTAPAASLVHELTGGVPRRINQLIDVALLTGMSRRADRLDEPLLRDVAATLEV